MQCSRTGIRQKSFCSADCMPHAVPTAGCHIRYRSNDARQPAEAVFRTRLGEGCATAATSRPRLPSPAAVQTPMSSTGKEQPQSQVPSQVFSPFRAADEANTFAIRLCCKRTAAESVSARICWRSLPQLCLPELTR